MSYPEQGTDEQTGATPEPAPEEAHRPRRTGRYRWLRWAAGIIAGLLLVVVALIAVVWWRSRPPTPDAFYTAPESVPATPGALLRDEAFTRNILDGTRAWRILYTTTRDDATPAVASALILAPAQLPPGPRPVIAWAHGTTGVARGCAPSLLGAPYPFDPTVPALDQVIAQGWIFVATDYVGLGTRGPHPYLIGEGETRSVLDAVRAARQIPDLSMENRTVVWGHSQGGNAALWSGILAPRYAPDVNVIGVAALAPASELVALEEGAQGTPVGKILSAYIVSAYSDVYPDIHFNDVVRRGARLISRDMAGRCLTSPEALLSVIQSTKLLGGPIFAGDPANGPLGTRLRENTPSTPIAAPLLIAQGLSDDLVLPRVQDQFVAQRCAAGQALEYRTYGGRDHVSVVAKDSPLNADLIRWTQDRLAGMPPPAGCRMAVAAGSTARRHTHTVSCGYHYGKCCNGGGHTLYAQATPP